jgi:hypothetical protein
LGTQTKTFARPTHLYGFLRAAARLRFYFPSIRVLETHHVQRPAILVVNAPESLPTTMLLTAAFDEPLLWVLNPARTPTLRSRFAAHLLGALTRSDPAEDAQALEQISDGLRTGKLVGLYSDVAARPDARAVSPSVKLLIALGERWTDPGELVALPVDVFSPPKPFAQWETLIAVGEPIYPAEHLHRAEGNPQVAAESLHAALHAAFAQNAFSLFPSSIERLEAELEGLLRADLRVAWAGRPNWRQSPDDFELSHRVREWIGRANTFEPARLVALAEAAARYRRAHRRWAERSFAAQTAGPWIESPLGRSVAWVEALAGLPLALYGLLNHWIALLALGARDRLRHRETAKARIEWSIRGGVVLAVYAAEILVCNRFLGRAAAGYYALTLPVSGLYLWRYVRLWQSRTRRLFFKLTIPFAARRLQQMRQKVALELDRQITASVEKESAAWEDSVHSWLRFS